MAGEIARTLQTLTSLDVPSVSVVMGQGCGGAALALIPAKSRPSVERPDSERDVTEMRLTGPHEPAEAGQLEPVLHGEQRVSDPPNAAGQTPAAMKGPSHE